MEKEGERGRNMIGEGMRQTDRLYQAESQNNTDVFTVFIKNLQRCTRVLQGVSVRCDITGKVWLQVTGGENFYFSVKLPQLILPVNAGSS